MRIFYKYTNAHNRDLTSLALIFVFVTSTLYSSTQIPIIFQKQGFLNENYIQLFEKVTHNNRS